MKEELADYSVDRLGKFDFALHSVGKLLSVSCCTFSTSIYVIGIQELLWQISGHQPLIPNQSKMVDQATCLDGGCHCLMQEMRRVYWMYVIWMLILHVYSVVYTCKTCQSGKRTYNLFTIHVWLVASFCVCSPTCIPVSVGHFLVRKDMWLSRYIQYVCCVSHYTCMHIFCYWYYIFFPLYIACWQYIDIRGGHWTYSKNIITLWSRHL